MASSKVQTVTLFVLSLVLLAHLAGASRTKPAMVSSEDLLSAEINQSSDCDFAGTCKTKADCDDQCKPRSGICAPYGSAARCCCLTAS